LNLVALNVQVVQEFDGGKWDDESLVVGAFCFNTLLGIFALGVYKGYHSTK
jgi:hypothetical protein